MNPSPHTGRLVRRFVVLAGRDLLDESLEIGSVERHGAVNERVKQHSERPVSVEAKTKTKKIRQNEDSEVKVRL